jgi:hypothetical protein
MPQYSPEMLVDLESPLRSRCKRSAVDAFSPTSAAFDFTRPAKRPISLAVEIPQSTGCRVAHPFPSRITAVVLKDVPGVITCTFTDAEGTAVPASSVRNVPPQTLIASYRLDPTKPRPVPKVGVDKFGHMGIRADTAQHLYFYSLAGSPMAEDSRSRKGLLRYHQPPETSAPSHLAYHPAPVPYAIQSASASPHHSSVTLPPVLPSHTAVSWTRRRRRVTRSELPAWS